MIRIKHPIKNELKTRSLAGKYVVTTRVFLFALTIVAVLAYGAIDSQAVSAKCTITDSGLNESSGLAASLKHPGIVYTHNDEKGPIFAINASTCKVVGKLNIKGARSDPDPEAITIDHKTGKVWFGDIGNGHPTQPKSMTDKKAKIKHPGWPARILVFDEPTALSGTINPRVVDITYQGGDHNSEALLSNPKTGQGYIIGKYAQSKVFKLPNPLKSGRATLFKLIGGWVTDATFTNDGRWILVRYRTPTDPAPTNVRVYDGTTWDFVGTIAVPKVPQGESITAEKNGRSFLIGSEGKNSPLVRVTLPSQYGEPAIIGDAIPGVIAEATCKALDRKVLTSGSKKVCAKRTDKKTVPAASQCADPKPGYAKFTYIIGSPDYCGYW